MAERVVKCDYCGEDANFNPGSDAFYGGRDFGPVWSCECVPGGAWVGCHKGSDRPLGRLADKSLRAAKSAAHAAFDPLWQRKMTRDGVSKSEARGAGYRWLAGQMGLTSDQCHIGMFNNEQCQRVVALCTHPQETDEQRAKFEALVSAHGGI